MLALTRTLIDIADTRGVRLRAIGGIGIDLRATDAPPVLRRQFADIDLAASAKSRRELKDVLEAAGLHGDPEFNVLQGARRQIWWTADRDTHVDVFLGKFAMCHRLDFEQRLDIDHPALPAADLLLMKLQVVELNQKDATDAAALLSTHALDAHDGPGSINRDRLIDVLSRDWGFYTTATDNLEKLPGLVVGLDENLGRQIAEAAAEIREEVERAPKSRAFKLRAKVGRRKQWYELPEESIT
jgi:hypothetical protein